MDVDYDKDDSGESLEKRFIKFWVKRLNGTDCVLHGKECTSRKVKTASVKGYRKKKGANKDRDGRKFNPEQWNSNSTGTGESNANRIANQSILERLKLRTTMEQHQREIDLQLDEIKERISRELVFSGDSSTSVITVQSLVEEMMNKLQSKSTSSKGFENPAGLPYAGDFTYDSITMFARVLNQCPRPSASSEDVWCQLLGVCDSGGKRKGKEQGGVHGSDSGVSYLEGKYILEKTRYLVEKANELEGKGAV